jgi:hypothetical protein
MRTGSSDCATVCDCLVAVAAHHALNVNDSREHRFAGAIGRQDQAQAGLLTSRLLLLESSRTSYGLPSPSSPIPILS